MSYLTAVTDFCCILPCPLVLAIFAVLPVTRVLRKYNARYRVEEGQVREEMGR
jgi:hypothetical protein